MSASRVGGRKFPVTGDLDGIVLIRESDRFSFGFQHNHFEFTGSDLANGLHAEYDLRNRGQIAYVLSSRHFGAVHEDGS